MSCGRKRMYEDQEEHEAICKEHGLKIVGDLGGWHLFYLKKAMREERSPVEAEKDTIDHLEYEKLRKEIADKIRYGKFDIETLHMIEGLLDEEE